MGRYGKRFAKKIKATPNKKKEPTSQKKVAQRKGDDYSPVDKTGVMLRSARSRPLTESERDGAACDECGARETKTLKRFEGKWGIEVFLCGRCVTAVIERSCIGTADLMSEAYQGGLPGLGKKR